MQCPRIVRFLNLHSLRIAATVRKAETNLSVHARHPRTSQTSAPRDECCDDEERWVNSLFLLFGTVLDQPGELEVVEVAGIVELLFVEHLFNFFLGEAFAHAGHESLEFCTGDHLGVFGVEALECVLDDVFGVRAVELLSEEGEEGGEVDVAGGFLDHVFEVGLWRVFAHGREHAGEILLGDEAVTILVDHVEGFLELLDLRLREQREHVGGGLLGLLFSGSLLLAHGDS